MYILPQSSWNNHERQIEGGFNWLYEDFSWQNIARAIIRFSYSWQKPNKNLMNRSGRQPIWLKLYLKPVALYVACPFLNWITILFHYRCLIFVTLKTRGKCSLPCADKIERPDEHEPKRDLKAIVDHICVCTMWQCYKQCLRIASL